MMITRTPLRISFFGGGTDYPVWYREHGGAVLATTINMCCYLTVRRLPSFLEYHSRISYTKVGSRKPALHETIAFNNVCRCRR
jgi:D-glycero-alpha-D-manno-heptose-7-phosphate kinase